MSEPREFTLEEASALVPALHRLVGQQMRLQSEIEDRLAELHRMLGVLPRDIIPTGDDPPAVFSLKEEISSMLRRLEEGWGQVQRLGCVVKDPRVGLVDLHGRVDGEPVFLCWKFGEEAIGHYHGLDEGFSGRRPLPSAARHRLLN